MNTSAGRGLLLLLAVAVSSALDCRAPAPAPVAPQQPQHFIRLLEDSAARARPDTVEACEGWQAAFFVEVRDSVTLKPAAWRATLTWRVGATIETTAAPPKWPMPVEAMATITGPTGRPGTYDLLIRKPGYRDWYRPGVVVEGTTEGGSGRCMIKPVHLRALLQRDPGAR